MDDEIVSFGNIISNTFKNIKSEDIQNTNQITDAWEKTLCSIKGAGSSLKPANQYEGQNLYAHSRILDLKNGVLLVEADHPGWIQLLQMHKNYILKGIQKASPNLKINTIAFRLKGKKGELYDAEENKTSVEKVRSNIQEKIEEEEKRLSESELNFNPDEKDKSNNCKKSELPPELSNLFDDLKKSVLTNSKK